MLEGSAGEDGRGDEGLRERSDAHVTHIGSVECERDAVAGAHLVAAGAGAKKETQDEMCGIGRWYDRAADAQVALGAQQTLIVRRNSSFAA